MNIRDHACSTKKPRLSIIVAAFPHYSQAFNYVRVRALARRGIPVHLIYQHEGVSGLFQSKLIKTMLNEDVTAIRFLHKKSKVLRTFELMYSIIKYKTYLDTAKFLWAAAKTGWNLKRAVGNLWQIHSIIASRPDVIQIAHSYLLPALLDSLELLRVPIIVSLNGADVDENPEKSARWREYFRTWGTRESLYFHCVSEHVMRRAQELGIPGRKCSVIYWGINVSDFSTETESLVHQPRERQRLITVARLAPEKGVDVALRALRQLRDMGYSLTYEVIGDGPENSRLEELAEFLGIEEYTNFRGWKSNDWVRGYLIRARDNCIYVQPSRREALSQAVLEAMAAGLPVITSNAGGLPEVVEDGATGLLFEVESVQGLVKVVETLLNDPDTANRLAQQGKKMVHGQFSDIVGAESFAALIKYL